MKNTEPFLSTSCSQTKLEVFTASRHSSTVRLECSGFGSEVIKIDERTTHATMKLDYATMLCLAHVLNQWAEKNSPKEGT